MKIFGVGLSKTGTTSLNGALEILGFRSIHYPHDETTHSELTRGVFRLSIMNNFDAATDISVAPYFAQLDRAFPRSKFILTTRDGAKWIESMKTHSLIVKGKSAHDKQFERFTEFISAVNYGVTHYEENRMLYAKCCHEKAVREYFSGRSNDFLEMNICKGEGWDSLAHFLGKEVPNLPFPKSNTANDARSWEERVLSVYDQLLDKLSDGSKVLLPDQDQLHGAFTQHAEIIPFLEKNGKSNGRPASSQQAIKELQRMKLAGSEYFLVTWTSFWWLGEYRDFFIYLQGHTDCLVRNDDMILFKL